MIGFTWGNFFSAFFFFLYARREDGDVKYRQPEMGRAHHPICFPQGYGFAIYDQSDGSHPDCLYPSK